MKDNGDGSFTVHVVSVIPKTLRSRDSAERLVRSAVTLWRKRSDKLRRTAKALILDFKDVDQLTESAAEALIEFREEFSEASDPEIRFSNLSASVGKALVTAEKNLRHLRGIKARKRKQNGFSIEV